MTASSKSGAAKADVHYDPSVLKKLLFVCAMNRHRSPTAEVVARQMGLRADSVGIEPDAVVALAESHLRWADEVICVDARIERTVRKRAQALGLTVKTVMWNLPDEYDFMERSLRALIARRLEPYVQERDRLIQERDANRF